MNINSKLSHLFPIAGIILFASFSVKASDKANYRTPPQYIQSTASKNAFTIVANGNAAAIYVDSTDWKGVIRTANDLGDDVRKVSGVASKVIESLSSKGGSILVGTIGKSRIIDQLIADKKIDVSEIKGQWESVHNSNSRGQSGSCR